MTKTVLITSSTRGLGRAMLDEFAHHGHRVIGCGRSTSGIEELRSRYPSGHDFTAVDVAHERQVAAWAKRIVEQHGSPDFRPGLSHLALSGLPSATDNPTMRFSVQSRLDAYEAGPEANL